jgi:hypothetical protein
MCYCDVIASRFGEAISARGREIASSQSLLAMTVVIQYVIASRFGEAISARDRGIASSQHPQSGVQGLLAMTIG